MGSSPEVGPGTDDVGSSADAEARRREEARLLRFDAALRHTAAEVQRSAAALLRVEAARERVKAAWERAAAAQERARAARHRSHELVEELAGGVEPDTVAPLTGEAEERERDADTREQAADDRERQADARDRAADERERLADARDRAADERERRADAREELAEVRRPLEGLQQTVRARSADLTATFGRLHRGFDTLRSQAADTADLLADEAETVAAAFEERAGPDGDPRRLEIATTERLIAATLRRNGARLRRAEQGRMALERLPRLPMRHRPDGEPAEAPGERGDRARDEGSA